MDLEESLYLSLSPLRIIRDHNKYRVFEFLVVELHRLLEVAASQRLGSVHLLVQNVVRSPDVNTNNVAIFSSNLHILLIYFPQIFGHDNIKSFFRFP